MRIVRPSSVDNVSIERLLDSLDQLNEIIASDENSIGVMVRHSARRTLIIDALIRRNVEFTHDEPIGNADLCRRLFKVKLRPEPSPQPR